MHPRTIVHLKMAAAGAAVVIGGPALVYYITPTEEELFKRYNPDLQRRALAERPQRLAAYAEFVTKLEEYSKSEKPIWVMAAADQARLKEETAKERKRVHDELVKQKLEILAEQKRVAAEGGSQ